jgi:hypothetical protein
MLTGSCQPYVCLACHTGYLKIAFETGTTLIPISQTGTRGTEAKSHVQGHLDVTAQSEFGIWPSAAKPEPLAKGPGGHLLPPLGDKALAAAVKILTPL